MLPRHKVVILSLIVAILAAKLCLHNSAVALPIDAALQVGNDFDALGKDRENGDVDSGEVLVFRHLLNKNDRRVRQDNGDDGDGDDNDNADDNAPGRKGRRKGRRNRGEKRGHKRGKENGVAKGDNEDENLQDNNEQKNNGQDEETKRRKKNRKGNNEADDDGNDDDGQVDNQDGKDKDIKKKKQRDEEDNEEEDENADDQKVENDDVNRDGDDGGKKRKKKRKLKEDADDDANPDVDDDEVQENDNENADADGEEKGKKKKRKLKDDKNDEDDDKNDDDNDEDKDNDDDDDDDDEDNENDDNDNNDGDKDEEREKGDKDTFLKKQEKEKNKREEKRKEKVDLLSSKDNLKGKTLPPKNIAFCHIEQTGGTTFKHILVDYAKKQNSTKGTSPYLVGSLKKLGSSPPESTDVNRIIYGSSKYINMRKKLCCGFYYFALVRNPLERLISKYASDNRLNSRKRSVPSISFYDYIVRNSKTENTNEQCRSLGIAEKSEVPLVADSLDLVITTDMFDEGLLLLKEEFRVDSTKYSLRRVAQGIPKVKDIDKRFQSLVELINSCDVALYEYAKNKLTERLKKQFKSDKDIEQKLTKFRSQLPKDECVNDELPDEENKQMCGLLDYRSVTDQLAQKFLFPDVEHYGPE